jgi:hypothetical protein
MRWSLRAVGINDHKKLIRLLALTAALGDLSLFKALNGFD